MAQRLNKKLLLGLGSTLGFLGTGVVSGFGINALITTTNNDFKQDQLVLNSLPEASFNTASDYNVATRDLFINTTNLKSFHFGNTQKGQTITPYGWLGVYEDNQTVKNRIALTGWNGEVLWVNEDYKNEQTSDFNVYEMKYDFNTNLIFVLRSGSQNGLVNDQNNSTGLTNLQLDILDATTGQRIANGGQAISANEFASWQRQSLNAIESKFLKISRLGNKKSITNLFQLDLVSVSNNKVLVNWMPNFLLLKDLDFQTFPNFRNVVDFFNDLTKTFVFEKIDSNNVRKSIKNFRLRGNSSEFSSASLSPNWSRFFGSNIDRANLNDYVTLVNPFFTVINGDKLILHLIVAKNHNIANGGNDTEITHKIIGFSERNGQHLGFSYDKSEQIGGRQIGDNSSYTNLLNIDPEINSNTAVWSRAASFGSDFINANLRINRNMFDGNSVVFAYPYAAQKDKGNNNFPIFNVAQLQIDQSSGLLSKNNTTTNKKRNTNWDFGKQFVEYYKRNSGNYNQATINKVYPYPNINGKLRKLNHNYHRLISVNSFDNTFVYAGKSNLTDRVLEQNDTNVSKYASFWISRNDRFASNGKGLARPLIIGNDSSLNSSVNNYMTDIFTDGFEGLYNDGFTFDPRSLETVSGGKKSLQLYFNQTGTGKNDRYTNNGFNTSKIGLLNDILKEANSADNNGSDLWVDNIANVSRISTKKNLLITGIDLNSYSTLIHSRANLTKWYSRTFWNSTNPGNTLTTNTVLNENISSSERAVASNFNQQLSGNAFQSKKAVDLVSAWNDKPNNSSKNPPNYNRLFVRRPEIKVRGESLANTLPINTTYLLNSNNFLNGWLPQGTSNRFIFSKSENITNASYQIFSSWSRQIRINELQSLTTETFRASEIHNNNNSNPSWFDVRRNNSSVNNLFGTVNNDLPINGIYPLRLMLRIAKPNGALPNWFNQINNDLFAKYPLKKDAITGETSFEEVLNNFIDERTRRIDLSENNNTNLAVGLGNLKIEGFVDLNPKLISDSSQNKIYKNGNKRLIVLNNTGLRIIYDDQYNANREIYDQSAIAYRDYNRWGFGSNGSDVRRRVQTSWTGQLPPVTQKLRTSVDFNLIQDKLVRIAPNDNSTIFTFKYDDNDKTKLILTPKNLPWFKNHFINYNRLLNLFVQFEYLNVNGVWTSLGSIFDDVQLSRMFRSDKLEIPSVPAGINQLRFRLVKKNDHDSDGNAFIDFKNFNNSNDPKLISVAHTIAVQKVLVNKNWFNQVDLSNATSTLEQIAAADLFNYEAQILNQSQILAANPELKAKIKLVYRFDNEQTDLDANALVTKIKNKLKDFRSNDQGVFALWNGITGIKIKARFTAVDDTVQLVVQNSDNPKPTDLTGFVKTTIKTTINLQTYIQELQTGKITAEQGKRPGELKPNSLIFPAKLGAAGQAQFNAKSFEQIKQILATVGISPQYKKWTGNAWSQWLNEIELVNTYNPVKPEIILGFKTNINNQSWNVRLLNGNSEFNDQTEISLALALPKLVKLPANEQQMLNMYKQQNPFSGDTFKLIVNENKLLVAQKAIINALKDASQGNNAGNDYDNLESALEFKYLLSNSQFLSIDKLKKFLAATTTDQNSNLLKFQVSLKQTTGADPEFVLDSTLANKEFTLWPDDNTVIKKWIHGTSYEAALKRVNSIGVSGNKNNLNFTFPAELQQFAAENTFPRGLSLAYQLNGTGTWNYGTLPTNVTLNVRSIAVKISAQKPGQQPANVYLYGPEINGNQAIQTIDLSRVTTLITINPTWFLERPISPNVLTNLDRLTETIITKWENEQIWAKIPATTDAAIKSKLIIKYKFLNHSNLTARTLPQTLFTAMSEYNNTVHHGIVKLFDPDGPTNSGIKITASFEKVDPSDQTVQLIDATGAVVDGNDQASQQKRSGPVNTKNVWTTLDFRPWLNHLLQNATNVITNNPGKIDRLEPPTLTGTATSNLFASQTFSDIEKWLKAAGIRLLWSSTQNGPNWLTTDLIKDYNPQVGKLWFAIENQSTNLIIRLNDNATNNLLNPAANNRNQPLEINLNAPKVISVNSNDLAGLDQAFSGNTKFLTVNETLIQSKINAILNRQGFNNAPLKIRFQVGNAAYYDSTNLMTELAKQTNDLESGAIKAELYLPEQDQNWKFTNGLNTFEQEIFTANNSPIKIFIHDQGIYEKLKNQTVLGGSNQALTITWPNGWTVGNDGILNAGTIGKGLKLEFSFNDLNQSAPAGDNIETQWVSQIPSDFKVQFTKLYVRLQVRDPQKFVYEKIASHEINTPIKPNNQDYKFFWDLRQLKQIIEVDGLWLNKQVTTTDVEIANFGSNQLQQYERQVFNEITDQNSKTKIQIRYRFNNEQNLLNQTELLRRISTYQNQKDLANNYGILKLWNGFSGIKISSTFVKAQTNGNYDLQWKDVNKQNQELDFAKIFTTIDLIKVVEWLKNIRVAFDPGTQANEIRALNFDPVAAAGSVFDQKSWADVEAVLERLNLKVEYLADYSGAPVNWSDLSTSINKFDPQKGIFKLRFVLEDDKAKNLKAKLNNQETLTIAGTKVSQPIIVNLQVTKQIILDRNIIEQQFINVNNVIRGNTKNLVIDANVETQMIKAILTANDQISPGLKPPYTDANLKVFYAIGNNVANINANEWKTLNDFLTQLRNINQDQPSNQINFKFKVITPAGQRPDFSVDESQIFQLNPHERPNTQTRIKYFVNRANWETQAAKVSLGGLNNALEWNLSSFGALGQQYEENNGQVYLRTTSGRAMQLQFTTKENANYNDPAAVSNDLQEIATKWISAKPTNLPANTKKVYIRIKANSGYVYEPEENRNAQAHGIDFNVRLVLQVNKAWFNEIPLITQETEIKNFNLALFNAWTTKIQARIAAHNKISPQQAQQIKVKFNIKNEANATDLTFEQLKQKLDAKLNDFRGPNLGIVQLWNGQTGSNDRGLKIEAFFSTTDPLIKLQDINNGSDFTDVINTGRIYTNIDLKPFIKFLETNKTTVVKRIGGQSNEIADFTPPVMKTNPAGSQFDQKTYNEIATRLNQVGITVNFSNSNNPYNWVAKNQITTYNPQIAKLFMAFSNVANNNIKLSLKTGLEINSNANNQDNPIVLNLAVPKQISIDQQQDHFNNLSLQKVLSGNTKTINLKMQEITTFISNILQRNAQESGDDSFKQAPLKIEWQVANEPFKETSALKNYLAGLNDDLTSRAVKFRFILDQGANQDWELANANTVYQLYGDDNNSDLKIFINEKNILNDLTNTVLKGNNTALQWEWQGGIQINPTDGILSATPVKGVGLRVEFTFNNNLTGTEEDQINIGNNAETQWTRITPKTFRPEHQNVYLRIRLTDSAKYEYLNLNQKITLSLANIQKVISLENDWLNQMIVNQPIALSNFIQTEQYFTAYEILVNQAVQKGGIDASLINGNVFKIVYQFDNQTYDKQALINVLKQYQTNKANGATLGILQLWNNSAGEKIIAKFVDANNNDNYLIKVDNNDPDLAQGSILNTTQVQTTIDFSRVITWLTQTTKLVQVKGTTPNAILTIPPVVAPADPVFNNKNWNQVAAALETMGITVQYREMLLPNSVNDETGWTDQLSNVKKYNDNIGKFELRFKFNPNRAQNIKFRTDNQTIQDGATAVATKPFQVSLNIKLTLQIDSTIVNDEFVSKNDVIEGNTKYLSINQQYETKMVQKILEANLINNAEFAKAQLVVKYKLAHQKADAWKSLSEFVAALRTTDVDQTSNKVVFRFEVIDKTNFAVDETERILFDPNGKDPETWKVKFYINNDTWENDARSVVVTGRNSQLIWQWNDLNVSENQGKVGTPALQVEFTTKTDAAYNDAAAIEDLAQLNQSWILVKPEQISATTKQIFIRLKAKPGYVYGPADNTNGNTASAAAHLVNLKIQREILVDPNLLKNPLINGQQPIFLNEINAAVINKFVETSLASIDQELRSQVDVKFSFNGDNNLDSISLFNKINAITSQNTGPHYGVLQLWNGQQGSKIQAQYFLKDTSGTYQLITNDGSNPTALQDVQTANILSKIDLRAIVTDLKIKKINFTKAADNTIQSWQMPNTTTGDQPLNGLNWTQFTNRLKALGIIIESRIVTNPDTTVNDWKPLEEIKNYDETTLQLAFRFKVDQNQGSNIVLSVFDDGDVGSVANPVKWESNEFKMNINAPATVRISQQQLNTFVNNNQIRGNTKFIKLDPASETNLINEISTANLAINPAVFQDLKNRLYVEYYLGDDGRTAQDNQWRRAADFKTFLENTPIDQITNQIWFRLNVINEEPANDPNYQTFNIDKTAQNLVQKAIGNKNARVKIFVHNKAYEQAADQISVQGTNNQFRWTFPANLNPNLNGQFNNIKGLRIQYSTKVGIQNQNYDSSVANNDPTNGWSNQQPTRIDPNDRHLVVQLVADDGYVYEAQYDQTTDSNKTNWGIHNVNLDQLQSEIKLSNSGLNQIDLAAVLPNLDITKIKQLEVQAKNRANFENIQLQAKVQIEYQIQWNSPDLQQTWQTIETLKTTINNFMSDFANDKGGLLKFNGFGTTKFATIKARFVAIDNQFVVVNQEAQNNGVISAANGQVIKTENLITPIDLRQLKTVLENNFVNLIPNSTQSDIKGFVPPGMENAANDIQFGGKTFDQIIELLNAIGLSVEYMAPQADGSENWVSDRKLIKKLNNRNELYLRFRIAQNTAGLNQRQLNEWARTFQIKTQNDTPDNLDQSNEYATPRIKLKVNLPILIATDANLLTTYGFEIWGNTWQINNAQALKTLAEQKINQLLTTQSSATTNLKVAPLKIQFSLGDIALQGNQQWFTIEELAQKLLAIQNRNFNTNEIKARWFIDEQQEINGQRYQISDSNAIVVQAQNNTSNALLKMYIHQGQYSNENEIVKQLIAQGTTEIYVINQLQNWKQMVDQTAAGLTIQLSNEANPLNWTNWNQNGDEPKPLNPNKDLWFRYSVKAGYQFANPDPNDPNATAKVKLNTTQIKIILKLQANWLKLIQLTGNLKDININENPAHEQLIQALPQSQPEPIIFEYTIDGQNWFKQSEFQVELKKLAGKKDQHNFILKREEIKVRFAWNKAAGITENQFGMMIDQVTIDNLAAATQFYTQLINDQSSLNSAVQGYINIQNLPDFAEVNFQITGSTSRPNFIVTKRNELNTALMPYASLNLFDILYSIDYDSNNQNWNWNPTHSVLKNGRLIDQNGLIDAGVQIGANKKFALKFISKNPKYDVYDPQGNQQLDGYVLDLSNQVKITIEIANPFTKQNKTLALWWTENRDRRNAKYYQGEGGFKIVNGTRNGLVDETNFESALTWLQSAASGLQANEINALEFVYHIYETKPDQNEIDRVGDPNLITNYNDQTWKSLFPVLETNSDHFTRPLNLKVGQYVSVALRVKKEYTTGDDIFVLANNDHSFMKPFNANQSQTPGRAHGYKIRTDLLEIEQDKIILENMLDSEQLPLDGYTNIKRLNLKKDANQNYQGVDLELQLFHQFYEGSQNQKVIITPFDKIKLIKRQSNNNASTKFFKNADGSEIKDINGDSIPILLDKNGKPTAPEEQAKATFKAKFTSYDDGFFGLSIPTTETERNQWGIFKNETVKIVFQAQEGPGGTNDPDFLLDKEKNVDLKNQISPQIKFPIFNQENVKYQFNYKDFTRDQVKFENATKPDANATDGKSKLRTLIKLIKTTNLVPEETIIEANNVEETIRKLEAELQASFAGKLRFETVYERVDGGNNLFTGLELYKLTNLKNNDRIKVRIVSADNDFIWAEPPKPLTIHVTGLTAKAPDRSRLRFLRVEQSGEINGQGAFKILINDPQNIQSDPDEILQGWKFVLRVWNKQKEIKYDWTNDQGKIVKLENGDKVEWKLVDEFGNPVDDAYYNTVAGEHQFNVNNGTTKLIFNEVNYSKGKNSAQIVREGIGEYPKDPNQYPEKSGFVIDGLKEELTTFEINNNTFAKIIAQLEPHYVGFNGQGTINFNEEYLKKNYYVNSRGELYEKSLNLPTLKQQIDEAVAEISLADFLANTTFYTSDPNLVNYQNGFKFLGNDTNLNNNLSNGDQIWAQFDLQVDNNEVNRGISTELNPVSGLQEVLTDPMTPLWYILMAIGGAITLGGLSLFLLWAKRHKKLKK